MSDLFQNVNGKLVPRDICARKHGGNEQSDAAFNSIKDRLTHEQTKILVLIAGHSNGITVDEMSVRYQRPPNYISGRVTELRIKGKIEKRGTRKTRSGCSAAVWVAV